MSSILADSIMQIFDNKIISDLELKPKTYIRYVDKTTYVSKCVSMKNANCTNMQNKIFCKIIVVFCSLFIYIIFQPARKNKTIPYELRIGIHVYIVLNLVELNEALFTWQDIYHNSIICRCSNMLIKQNSSLKNSLFSPSIASRLKRHLK